jgi:hypothetical protein
MVAEKLWSSPNPPNGGLDLLTNTDMSRRLRRHRCRLVARGLPVGQFGGNVICKR